MYRKENGVEGKGSVTGIDCYITNHPKLSGLKQHIIISHCFVGREFGQNSDYEMMRDQVKRTL